MTLDGFLTFFALVAAVWALVPRVRLLTLRLYSGVFIVISGMSLILVLYFEFFDIFAQPCPTMLSNYCSFLTLNRPNGVSANQAAFLVVLFWLFVVSFMAWRPRASVGSLPALSKLAGELSDDKRHGELVQLMEPFIAFVDKVATRQLWFQKAYDTTERAPSASSTWGKVALSIKTLSLRDGVEEEDVAADILRLLLRSPDRTNYYVKDRPYFGMRLLALHSYGVRDFSDALIAGLVEHSDSILYDEIGATSDSPKKHGYEFSSHSRFLRFLFSDATVSHKLEVYRPVGESVIKNLRSMSPQYAIYLNDRPDHFHDSDKWRDPTFIGLRFFDIMVTNAAHQNVGWHMWLYYLDSFLEAILEVHDAASPRVDQDTEWPTRGLYLIYELFDTLRSWIRLIDNLRDDSCHLQLDDVGPTHENGHIPKSAILCAGSCMRRLLMAGNISDRFKSYILDMVLRQLRDMDSAGARGRFREALVEAVVAGGASGPVRAYGVVLKAFFSRADYVLRLDLDDFKDVLDRVYP
jgi:hypothetical protein